SASIWALASSNDDPLGSPRASRVTVTPVPASRFEASRAVPSPSSVGLGARITSRTPPRRTRSTSAVPVSPPRPPPSRGADRPPPVEGCEPAAEHVVEPLISTGPLEGRYVSWGLDHAQQPGVAPGVGADRTQVAVRQVEALAARADLLGYRPQGVGEAARV